jgi:drug/metabolite transporter (DMT)-like permease
MVLGVLFSFLASVCFNLNNLMEKRAVDRMAEISARRAVHMLRLLCSSPLWMSGFLVGIVAVGLMVIAYSLAPIAVAQSIFGAGLVLLVLASRLYLHEPMGRREWVGVTAIIVAVVLVSMTIGSSSSPGVGGSTAHVLLASAATAALSALVFAVLSRSSAEAGVPFGVTSGLLYGVAALQVKGASVLLSHQGVLGTVRHLFASPYPYLFAVSSVLGLLTFQTGLQRCRVGVVAPISNIVASIYVVAVGMVVFDESLPSHTVLTVLRILGFVLVLAGGWVFATGPASAAQLERHITDDLDAGAEDRGTAGNASQGSDPGAAIGSANGSEPGSG